ncbi:MAG: hypothetical protein IM638_17175 [Bacteroidetes bacterium]|jgi:hypothetical protein|nr:hypothetical protein [Bacteroidota bacterium]
MESIDTKLTLKLAEPVIAKAKQYAYKERVSLSFIIETYLDRLTAGIEPDEVSPLVKSLSGVVNAEQLEADKVSYKKHLKRKYSK